MINQKFNNKNNLFYIIIINNNNDINSKNNIQKNEIPIILKIINIKISIFLII